MPKEVICANCGSNRHYKTFCPWQKRKPIPQKGKHARLWQTFRDEVARPYLDKKYGRICSVKGCAETENLDVDHKQGRGSHPGLRYDVKNMQYMCRPHHIQKTDGKL